MTKPVKTKATSVTVTCRDCGERTLTPKGVGVKVWSDGRCAYAYFCDQCYLPHQYLCDDKLVRTLVEAGAHFQIIEVPDEFAEITAAAEAPAICVKDILTFMDGLADTYDRKDWPAP